jgi:hypothetical protein
MRRYFDFITARARHPHEYFMRAKKFASAEKSGLIALTRRAPPSLQRTQ